MFKKLKYFLFGKPNEVKTVEILVKNITKYIEYDWPTAVDSSFEKLLAEKAWQEKSWAELGIPYNFIRRVRYYLKKNYKVLDNVR